MRRILVGIDIGTTNITAVVARRDRDGKVRIIGVGSSPSAGLRKGGIVAAEEAAQALRRSVLEAGRQSGITIRSAVIGVGGAHLNSFTTRGVIAVSRPDGEITENDVRRVMQAAEGFIPKNPNREIIHLIPREFKIDGQGGISDPAGMVGMKLEAEALVIDGSKPVLQNIIKCCELSGIEIEDWVASPLAAAEVLLTPKQKELGAMLLDLGAGTSDFAVFEEGRVLDVGSFPIGGSHITSDIAIGFRTSVAVAEAIKVRYAQTIGSEGGRRRDTIQLADFTGGYDAAFALRDLTDIVVARLTDIFELATKALRKIGRAGLLPGGVVLSGGVADIAGIQDLARREMKLPVEVAKAVNVEPLAEVAPPRLAIPVGLILWPGAEAVGLARSRRRRWLNWVESLKRMLRAFVP